MARVRYTLAMNAYLDMDFYSWIMVCLVNSAGAQILANPSDVRRLRFHTVCECLEHSLYCHLNASHLVGVGNRSKTH